jgi:hypothetical protein
MHVHCVWACVWVRSVTRLRHAGVDLVKRVAARAEADLEARAVVSAAARAKVRAQEEDTESVLREVACAQATLQRRQHTRVRVRGARKGPAFERGGTLLLSVSDVPEESLAFESAPIPALRPIEATNRSHTEAQQPGAAPTVTHSKRSAPHEKSEAHKHAGHRVRFAATAHTVRTATSPHSRAVAARAVSSATVPVPAVAAPAASAGVSVTSRTEDIDRWV